MNAKVKQGLNIALSVGLAAGILAWAYGKTDIRQIGDILATARVRYGLLGIAVGMGIAVNAMRAWRWKLVIDGDERKAPVRMGVVNSAVWIGYMVNYLIPRAGEVARCGVVAQKERRNVAELVGTMLSERATDMALMVALLAAVGLGEHALFGRLAREHLSLPTARIVSLGIGAGIIVTAGLMGVWIVKRLQKKGHRLRLVERMKGVGMRLADGMAGVVRLRQKGLFGILSIGIWAGYYAMMWLPCKAFDFTASLGAGDILFVMMAGSLGMLAPVQGGIGAWHYMTIVGMGLFGIGREEAGAFALVVHGMQTVVYIFGGVIGLWSVRNK